jgi:hypothetical protein
VSRCLQRKFLRISVFAARAPVSVALFAAKVPANLTISSESSCECRVVSRKVPVALFAASVLLGRLLAVNVPVRVCVALFCRNKT